MREPEAWQQEPRDWFECVFGPSGWATEAEVQQEIGPEWLMYWSGEQEEPARFP